MVVLDQVLGQGAWASTTVPATDESKTCSCRVEVQAGLGSMAEDVELLAQAGHEGDDVLPAQVGAQFAVEVVLDDARLACGRCTAHGRSFSFTSSFTPPGGHRELRAGVRPALVR